jgi:hypothetical protein
VIAASLIVTLASVPANSALAAPASEGAVQGPALPSVEDEPGELDLPDVDVEPAPDEVGELEVEAEAAVGEPEPSSEVVEPPPPGMQEPDLIHVAVGFATGIDGSKDERALLDRLERSIAASPAPKAEVRRLRVGAAEPREICREGRDDLVITIGYAPDQTEPVLFVRDCRIDEELGMRRSAAADEPDLLAVLWSEHKARVADGAQERRRARISPKVRTGLIAGAAVAVIGIAVGLLIAGAVRRETVVLVVSPQGVQ